MYIYIVRQEAVYFHNIIGIFETLDKALDCAKHSALNLDYDSHHDHVVTRHTIGDSVTEALTERGEMDKCKSEKEVFRTDKHEED